MRCNVSVLKCPRRQVLEEASKYHNATSLFGMVVGRMITRGGRRIDRRSTRS
jgi:hypothetical protein